LKAGAQVHVIFQVYVGWPFSSNPLRCAIANRHHELVQLLLDKGCFIDNDTVTTINQSKFRFDEASIELVKARHQQQEAAVRSKTLTPPTFLVVPSDEDRDN